MEYFSAIKDADIFENPVPEPKEYIDRPTVKGVVIDKEGDIALLHARGHALFPGGGIEQEETEEEAFKRECMEEIGCDVEIDAVIGKALQFRAEDAKKYEVYFFVARVIGEKGKPTTLNQGELDLTLTWDSKEEVKTLLENQPNTVPKDDYPLQFNCRTHLAAFKKYLEMSK